MMTQKLLMCILLMVFLARFEAKKNRTLAFIADSSFAIYLLHPFVIHGLERFCPELRNPALPDIPMLLLATALITTLSLAMAIVIRKIAGQYSRNIIGW
jgi:surface polysaccharide O-acyltransferase-like enzyme